MSVGIYTIKKTNRHLSSRNFIFYIGHNIEPVIPIVL